MLLDDLSPNFWSIHQVKGQPVCVGLAYGATLRTLRHGDSPDLTEALQRAWSEVIAHRQAERDDTVEPTLDL